MQNQDTNEHEAGSPIPDDLQPDVPPLSELVPDITPEMMQEIKQSQEMNIADWEEQNEELAKTIDKLNGPKVDEDEEEEGEGQ